MSYGTLLYETRPVPGGAVALITLNRPDRLNAMNKTMLEEMGAACDAAEADAAVRAVGITNGRNPVALVLPCHRVIGADGSLTGYAGGIERKRWLLRHEGALPATLI